MSEWFCNEVTLKVNYSNGTHHTITESCGGEIARGKKIWPFSGPTQIIVPKRYSYACSNVTFLFNNTYILEIGGMQLEPNLGCPQGFKFSNGYDCVGFFSIGILSSLFVTFILAGGLFIGIMMMMSIQTPERFDDPKGPTITVPSTE